MNGITVNEYRLVGFGGAGIFTGPASDANIIFHLRDKEVSFKRNHMTSFGRAVLRTGAACSLLGTDNAVILNKYCLAQLCQLLGFHHQGHYGACGAHISAAVAVIDAEPAVEIHPGLHDTCKSILIYGWLDDTCGAYCYA